MEFPSAMVIWTKLVPASLSTDTISSLAGWQVWSLSSTLFQKARISLLIHDTIHLGLINLVHTFLWDSMVWAKSPLLVNRRRPWVSISKRPTGKTCLYVLLCGRVNRVPVLWRHPLLLKWHPEAYLRDSKQRSHVSAPDPSKQLGLYSHQSEP